MKRLFSPWVLLLCVIGLGINLALSKLVLFFGLPLYMDNVGSILTAALGGALPGMAVGFLSNLLGSISEPVSMYYGILTVLIAWLASVFSKKGYFKCIKGWLLSSFCFILIGGAAGSIMTWFLYGGGIGGIASPIAYFLLAYPVSEFAAQLTADIIIDIPDKLLTVGIVCVLLHFYPKKWRDLFPLSQLYGRGRKQGDTEEGEAEQEVLSHSVNTRVVTVIAVAMTLIGVMAVIIGTLYHHQQLINTYETIALAYSGQAADCVDGDLVEDYLQAGEDAEGYSATEEKLEKIRQQSDQLKYIYVYLVREDGCHVVFDLDTPDVPGEAPGTVIPNETYFYDNLDYFLAGAPIKPEFTRGRYGALITGYTPIRNSQGETVAYAGVDLNLDTYVMDLLTYMIQVLSLLFAIVLVISAFALWYVNRHITEPIHTIVKQSKSLDHISPEKWLESKAWKNRRPIHTDDEIEELYQTVCKVEENASRNVKKLMETEQQLLQTKELERINRKLEETISKADEANRAKTDFLSRMSHDIRTPLNAIVGTAELAKEDCNDPQAISESLTTITTAGKFLVGLINDILDINKIETGKIEMHPEQFAVTEFIQSVETTIRPLAEKKHITFRFEMNCGHGLILVDKLRYKQIFFNLLSNAIKYTPQGGTVEFIAEALDAPEGTAGVRNYIRDTGIGMSKEYMTHLYEAFTRDQNAAINQIEGSGLGLAIVKNIVDAMGGTIEVSSTLGVGTEFIVDLFLPIPQVSEAQMSAPAANLEQKLEGTQILLVEDNEINTKIARKMLEKKGCTVTAVANGEQAVKTFHLSTSGFFDLILMDIRMPVMDGLTATRLIRAEKHPDAAVVPIIAMTANAYEEDVRRSLEAGMNAHISKPIEPQKLYEQIAEFIRR